MVRILSAFGKVSPARLHRAGCALPLLLPLTAPAAAQQATPAPLTVTAHQIAVALDPARGTLDGSAVLELAAAQGDVELWLGSASRLVEVVREDGGRTTPVAFGEPRTGTRVPEASPARAWPLALGTPAATRLRVRWSGSPPTLPADMKFTRDEVLDLPGGYLSERGAFLGGDAGWYPTGTQELSRFILEATVPAEWRVVSEGRLASAAEPRAGRRSERYEADNPLEAISLVAAPWTVREEQRAGSRIAVYALPGTEASLVETYLAAAAGYVERYTREIGAHAWPQFVVAEHILPTGYGFPSFTLLGSAVMRLPFIVKTSLGHEVLHDWWGNGVYVDRTRGNWCEGLTAYMADHSFAGEQEPGGDVEYRRQILRDYREYTARGGEERAVSAFRERHSRADRALGYGKVAMIFHMLRRELGDDAFRAALRSFYRTRRHQLASWDALREAFSQAAGRPLDGFFAQWVDRPGAPDVRFAEPGPAARAAGEDVVIEAGLALTPGWRVTVPVELVATGPGDAPLRQRQVGPSGAEGNLEVTFRVPTGTTSAEVRIDPDVDLFRQLDAREIPATLARILAGPPDLVVLGSARGEPLRQAARSVADGAVRGQAPIRPDVDVTAEQIAAARRLYVIGLPAPETAVARAVGQALPAGAAIHDDRFVLAGRQAAGTEAAACFVLEHGKGGDGAVAFLDALSPGALLALGRRVQHYGKYSWLLFEGDRPVLRETAPPPLRLARPVPLPEPGGSRP